MMKLWVLFIILVAASLAQAKTESSLLTGSYFESNTFYANEGDRGDGVVRVAPKLVHDSASNYFGMNLDFSGSYNKYFKYSSQDFFDYRGNLKVPINPEGGFSVYFGGGGEKISDPAIHYDPIYNPETSKDVQPARIDRNIFEGFAGFKWRASALSTIRAEAKYILESYPDKYHTYLNNTEIKGEGFYDYQFLPETIFFIGGTAGNRTYPNGKKNLNTSRSSEFKLGSSYVEGRMGISGRLAEKTSVEASGALLYRVYEKCGDLCAGAKTQDFSEPVFNLRVEEQFSPKDLLVAGFDYEVHDSKFTNFVIEQTTFIGYSRILGDQVLALGKAAYTASSYSKPFKREDQRLVGSLKLDYSLNPTMKISILGELDIMNSDQINSKHSILNPNEPVAYQPDKPASYEYLRAGAEFIQFF